MAAYKNSLSTEQLHALVNSNPHYRSAAMLGRYLGVTGTTAKGYLLDAGIVPMTLGEAAFYRMGNTQARIPQDLDLIKLIETHPEYRSPVTLGKFLKISRPTARRYLLDAGITPLNPSEASLQRFQKTNVKILTRQELVKLVTEQPEYRSATELGRYLGFSASNAKRHLLDAGIVPMTLGEAALHIRFRKVDVKILTSEALVKLVTEHPEYRNASRLSRYLCVTAQTAGRYLLDAGIVPMTLVEAVLHRFEDINVKIPIREALIKLVSECPDYRNLKTLAHYLGISEPTAKKYLINAGITPINSRVYENKLNDAPSFREFVETHEDAQRVVSLFYHESTAGGTIDMLAARILALYYPDMVDEEVASEYLPSLGPYIGRFKIPYSSGFGGDVIGSIPMPMINNDNMLREGFLKIGRDYYMSLLQNNEYPSHEDEEALLGLIKEKAVAEGNETLKWLHETLYGEFQRFLTLTRKARNLMPEKEAMA